MSIVSRAEQKAATRARLLRIAQRVFTRHGYDETSIGLVCRTARVTHGALYHHFASKTELFAAVLELVLRDVATAIEDAVKRTDGWQQISAACDAYLTACTDPSVQMILLHDGPRVLASFKDIDHAANEPLVTGLLRGWIDAGLLRPMSTTLVARVLGGAFAEAGIAISTSTNPDETRRELHTLFMTWLEALRR